MSEVVHFKEINGDLPETARSLAIELRTLFGQLDLSLNRYASRVNRDPGAVSRYFGGTRIPPWGFVYDLLVHSTMHNDGAPPTQPVVEHLMRLHRSALEAGRSPAHQVQLLQDRLADADREATHAATRENELEKSLQAAEEQIARLVVRERELEAARAIERDAFSAEIAVYQRNQDAARDAHRVLFDQIVRLKRELGVAHKRRMAAEHRCTELERQLEASLEDDEQVAADARSRVQIDLEQLRAHAAADAEQMKEHVLRAADARESAQKMLTMAATEAEQIRAAAQRDAEAMIRRSTAITERMDTVRGAGTGAGPLPGLPDDHTLWRPPPAVTDSAASN